MKDWTFSIMNHCIACTTCSLAAKATFALNSSCTSAIIIRQPKSIQDKTSAFQALKSCPVGAIGVEQ